MNLDPHGRSKGRFLYPSAVVQMYVNPAEVHSLLNQRLQDIAILMYKVKCGLAPSIVRTNYLSRKALVIPSDFDIPTFNIINYGQHSLRYQGPYIWSKLDK